MCQKSIINSPKTAVSDMLEGMGYTYPGLYIEPKKGIVLIDKDRGEKVALVCGCEAGFEPFASGYVGEGMLTGYVSGKIGKAPKAGVILSVIVRLSELNKGGVLILVLNYRRDVLNFGLAIERARCIGLKVEVVVLVDDCSRLKMIREQHISNLALKKGLCGSVFAFKILGAMSSSGASILQMVNEARNINFRAATLGFVSESFCYLGAHRPAYTLEPNEVVIGMGMNGEHGIKTIEHTSARNVVRAVMSIIWEEANLNSKSCVFVMVNRFSSMTVAESYIIAKEVYQYLVKKKVSIWRLLVSQFMTSYDAKGAQISVLNVTGKSLEWLKLLEKDTEAYGWPNTKMSSIDPDCPVTDIVDELGPEPQPNRGMILTNSETRIFRKCIESACKSLIDAELVLNQLNAYHSNGDCGTNMRNFACMLLHHMNSKKHLYNDVSLVFQTMERIAEEVMEGSIGSVYSALLHGASCSSTSWLDCFQGAVNFLGIYFPIVRGYRTLFDVIEPTCEELVDHYNLLGEDFWRASLQLAVDKAEKCCCDTYVMKPKVGLNSYGSKRNMDAGAYSVVVWLRAINNSLKKLLPFSQVPPPEEEDWRHRLQYLLMTLRPLQPASPVKDKIMTLSNICSELDFVNEEGEEEQSYYEM